MTQAKATTTRATKSSGGASATALKTPGLPAERMATVRTAAEGLAPADVTRAPGGLPKRLQRMQGAMAAALAKWEVLVGVPMAPEADLTREELARTADLVTALGLVIADAGAADADPADAEAKRKEQEARKLQAAVLRGVRHVFRADRSVRQWVRKVARGEGIADLVADADEMSAFWKRNDAALGVLTRGERAALTKMVAIADALRPTVKAADDATAVRRLRDAIYTLAARGIVRVRVAVEYAFEAGDPALAAFRTAPPQRKKKVKVEVKLLG